MYVTETEGYFLHNRSKQSGTLCTTYALAMADVVQLFGSIDKEVNKVFQKNQLNVQYNVFFL